VAEVYDNFKTKYYMRTILRFVLFVFLALSASPGFSNSEVKAIKENTKENRMSNSEAQRLLSRLREIRGMDKSALTTDKKKDLRKEVNNIKDQVQKNRPGYFIYISLTALIIIILLILLL
jgi:hypothetical protein